MHPPAQAHAPPARAQSFPVQSLTVGGVTDIGRKRSQNQDAFRILPAENIFVVADGMGGHRGGEIASTLAVEKISETLTSLLKGTDAVDPAKALRSAIGSANRAIFERATIEPPLQGMGTTVVLGWWFQGLFWLGQVGDSRCYLLRDRNWAWQVTRDHSLVTEKLRAGLITREELKTDRMRNVITRSVGFEDSVQVDVYPLQMQTGDWILICSDGLSGMMSDEELRKVWLDGVQQGLSPQVLAEELVQRANECGGEDNITAVLVNFS